MKKKNKIYILLAVILITMLAIGFLVWWNHKKTIDKKYQACLDNCETEYCGFSAALKGSERITCEGCRATCREKYAQKSKK